MSDEWFYSSPRTLLGVLQLGLGRGAVHAESDPAAASEAVLSCLRHDHRWWWMADDRAVYLARLVRDLDIPIARVLAVLDEIPPEDDGNGAGLTLEVLEVLGRAGYPEAVDGVRRHILDGPHWIDALWTVCPSWDPANWDDLYPYLRERIATADPDRVPWAFEPWKRWAEQDPQIAAAIKDARSGPARVACELPQAPDLPQARQWAQVPDHPRYWRSAHVLAKEGDERDVPVLLEAVNRVETRPDGLNWCYLTLIEGLARIGGEEAAEITPRLRRLWLTPHTYERAAVLKALKTFAAVDECPRQMFEGLWDCEADVREFAAAHVESTDRTRQRLTYLRDDPMETPEVRATAAQRLA